MKHYFKTENLAVGYDGNILIRDINVKIERGKILTLIGPNGAGKSTLLKSIARRLKAVSGTVYINSKDISSLSPKAMAKQVSVVLTERIAPEWLTCSQVVAMGRYPYTNFFGKLTPNDEKAVNDALKRVHALDMADKDFSTLSDGQRQRIMLARALCQEPEIIVLDEPTAYLDIRHKIELLDILREMAQQKKLTVIMSLHEIDMAMKVSDYLMCVKGDRPEFFGSPDMVSEHCSIENLFGLNSSSYNMLFGGVELAKPKGNPKIFVVAGGGYGISCYRALQKRGIPFATGILFENDVDYQVAKELSDNVVVVSAFEPVAASDFKKAAALLHRCKAVIDAGTPIGSFNQPNYELLRLAEEDGIFVYRGKDLREEEIWNI